MVLVLLLAACSSEAEDKATQVAEASEPVTTTASSEPVTSSTTTAPSSTTATTRKVQPYTKTPVTSPPVERPDLPRLPALDPAALDGLVDELVTAEQAIRSASTPAADVSRLAQRAQATYRMLSTRTDLLPRALERVPAALRSAVDANVTAGAELRALTKPKAQFPPWRIIAPPPAEELRRHYTEAEGRFGIPWQYLASIHLVETRMGRIRGTSSAGAQGPMQFLPSTWARYGEGGDINDPRDSIMAAGRYLKAAGAPGDLARALFAYNHSQHYVRAVTLYAEQMRADERTYAGYHAWQVYYITPSGDTLLAEGYGS
jgi:transglycosylase-like protein with SLT domain